MKRKKEDFPSYSIKTTMRKNLSVLQLAAHIWTMENSLNRSSVAAKIMKIIIQTTCDKCAVFVLQINQLGKNFLIS